MRVTIGDLKTQRFFNAVHGVKRQEASLVVSSEEEVLHSLVHTTIRDKKEKKFHFRNVMMHPYGAQIDSPFVLEDTLTSVGEEGVLFLALQNQVWSDRVQVKTPTVKGKAVLTKYL